MKKLIVTVALSIAVCTAFAQKVFKPIHFTSYCDYTPNRPLDGIEEKRGPQQQTGGTIDIDTKDMWVTITNNGQAPARYKITYIRDEVNYGKKRSIIISYTNENDKTRSFEIARTGTIMEFVQYNDRSSTLYSCDYLEDLY